MDENPAAVPRDEALVSLGGEATSEGTSEPPARLRDALVPGALLAGRYRVERFLARGGMGEVHEAHDQLLDVALALKTLRLDLEGDPVRLRRFKRELLLARSITHPNVCRVYDLEVDRSTRRVLFFLTMELLAGETLRSRIVSRGRMTPGEALPLIRQMATALQAAHAAGIVHRDFKSGNVMLVPTSGGERVVVTDFGLANAAADVDATAADSLVGTPAYMAPEQMRGDGAGPAADLYALGVVIFEMMTGALPFPGATHEAALERLHRDAPSPRTIVPALDQRFEAVILRLLARDPRERFASAPDAVRALEGVPRLASRHNLRAERDAFVGRETELLDLARRIDAGARLLTIVGVGGSGKTRLARRFGWMALDRFPGGAWFAELSEARTLDGLVRATATALDVPLGKDDPVVQIGHAIAGRGRCLVILDNFEQVAREAEATLGRWIDRCAEACFVVTTREVLGLPGEELVACDPLTQEDAEALFVMRARTARHAFDPGDDERRVIARLVKLLDRLPLAIELAAARVRVLTPQQVLERMGERFKLLSSSGARRDRQATLRITLDWSWDLLSAWEKATLAQLSVFEGGFTLGAAEEVIDLSAWPEAPSVLDVIQALVDKSLLRIWVPEVGSAGPRFTMYVSLHEYAADKLRTEGVLPRGASGAEAERAVSERHGRHYARLGSEESLAALDTHGGVARYQALALELENVVAACRRAVGRADGPTAVATLAAAWTVLLLKGPFVLGEELGRQVLGLSTLEPADRGLALRTVATVLRAARGTDEARKLYEEALAIARADGNRRHEGIVLGSLGSLHHFQGRNEEALRHHQEALAIHREVGNRRDEGLVLGNMGLLCHHQGRWEAALRHYEDALSIHREVGNRRVEGVVLGHLGNLRHDQGRMDDVLRHYEEALAIAREVGSRRSEGIVLANLGNLHHIQGRMEEALRYCEEALAIAREVGDRRFEGMALGNLGDLHHIQGRMQEALHQYQESLAIIREVGDRRNEGNVLGNLGVLHDDLGLTDEALRYYQEALAVHREVGNRGSEGHVLGNLGVLHAGQGRLEAARESLVAGEALLRAVNDRVELGRLLCDRGECELLSGDLPAARGHLAEAEVIARGVDAGPDSDLGRAVARLRALLDASPEPPRD